MPDADTRPAHPLWEPLRTLARELRLAEASVIVVSEALRSPSGECDLEAFQVLQQHVANALNEQRQQVYAMLRVLDPKRAPAHEDELILACGTA